MSDLPYRKFLTPIAGALSLTAAISAGSCIASAYPSHNNNAVIEGTQWSHVGSRGHLTFKDGRVTGNDSCNTLFGNYTITPSPAGTVLTFDSIASTLRYCAETVPTQRAFSALFSRPNGYRITTLPSGEKWLTLYPADTGLLNVDTLVFTNRG